MTFSLFKIGDKFDKEEIEKFLAFAINPNKGTIDYANVYEKMVVPEVVDILEDKRKLMAEMRDETKL